MGFLHNLHASVGAISRKTVSVIAFGNGVSSSQSLEKWQTTVAMLSSLSHGHEMYGNCLIGLKNIELQQKKRWIQHWKMIRIFLGEEKQQTSSLDTRSMIISFKLSSKVFRDFLALGTR